MESRVDECGTRNVGCAGNKRATRTFSDGCHGAVSSENESFKTKMRFISLCSQLVFPSVSLIMHVNAPLYTSLCSVTTYKSTCMCTRAIISQVSRRRHDSSFRPRKILCIPISNSGQHQRYVVKKHACTKVKDSHFWPARRRRPRDENGRHSGRCGAVEYNQMLSPVSQCYPPTSTLALLCWSCSSTRQLDN